MRERHFLDLPGNKQPPQDIVIQASSCGASPACDGAQMNVTFHALAAAGIAHIAAALQEASSGPTASHGSPGARGGWETHGGKLLLLARDVWIPGTAICLGVLSHGVLDGLKHGYPLPATADVLVASVLAIGWCLCVHRRFGPLFAGVMLASFAPDIVDLGPAMVRSVAGPSTPLVHADHIFPWHWPDGSGSMYPGSGKTPGQTRILDTGRNALVSWTNHLIVVAFAASGILANPRVFRFWPGKSEDGLARGRRTRP
jgi:hypothetical protein